MKLKKNKKVSLSEQQLVDCAEIGCITNRGFVFKAFDYIKSVGGIESEVDYPYRYDVSIFIFDDLEYNLCKL